MGHKIVPQSHLLWCRTKPLFPSFSCSFSHFCVFPLPYPCTQTFSASVSQVISTPALCQAEYDAGDGSRDFFFLTPWIYCYVSSIKMCYFSFFSVGNVWFHIDEISYMLDISSLFYLLTLKPIYPVLRTAFLQLTTGDLFTAGYFHACNPTLSVPLAKDSCYCTIPLLHIIFLGSKIFYSA